MLFTPWSKYRISSLSLGPPGLSGCLRGCGSGDACCDGAAEEAGGVGNSGLVAGAIAKFELSVIDSRVLYDTSVCDEYLARRVWNSQGGKKAKSSLVSKQRGCSVILYQKE